MRVDLPMDAVPVDVPAPAVAAAAAAGAAGPEHAPAPGDHPWHVRIGGRAGAAALRGFAVHAQDADTARDRALAARFAERYGVSLSWFAARTLRRALAAAVPPAAFRVTGSAPAGEGARTVAVPAAELRALCATEELAAARAAVATATADVAGPPPECPVAPPALAAWDAPGAASSCAQRPGGVRAN